VACRQLCHIPFLDPHDPHAGLGQQEVQLEYDAVSGSLDVVTSQPSAPAAPAAPSAPAPAPVPMAPMAPMAPAAGVRFVITVMCCVVHLCLPFFTLFFWGASEWL